MLIIGILQALGHWMYPPPEGLDPNDVEALKAYLAVAPPGAFVSVLVAWAVGTYVGAGITANRAPCCPWIQGGITGGVLMACGIYMLIEIPSPGWFVAATLLVFPLAASLGILAHTQPLPGDHENWTEVVSPHPPK
jgi:hypothetical protein